MPGPKPAARALRAAYLITLLGLSVRAAASSIEPTVIGFDPWHMHVVVGTRDPQSKQAALLNHSHHNDQPHVRSAVSHPVAGEHGLAISIVDNVRAMLSMLSASASDSLLAPQVWAPLVVASMLLALGSARSAASDLLRRPPPTPPPRPAH